MGFISGIVAEISSAIEVLRTLRAWTSRNIARVMFVISFLAIALLSVQHFYVGHLLTAVKNSNESRMREMTNANNELSYKLALDAIVLCLDSAKDRSKLQDWYCEQAIVQYKKVSATWPQERVKEVIERLAYGAMKNDVSNYLRSAELDRLIQQPESAEKAVLDMLLSKIVFWLWLFFGLALIFGTYYLLWVSPNNKKGTPDE